MTTPARPGDLVPLAEDECLRLLADSPYVRIGFVVDGVPTIVPINVLPHAGAYFFRTAAGSKLGTAAATGQVVLEADGGETSTRMAWSVVVHGRASIVTDPDLEETLLSRSFEPWAVPDERQFWVQVDPDGVTGRRIVRDPVDGSAG